MTSYYQKSSLPTETPKKSPAQSTANKEIFSFFRLPKELRDMVYGVVFGTSLGDGAITPDPHYLRRRLGGSLTGRTINNGVGLLQSCQQAHEEATVILYGNHVFYFDDTTHGTWGTRMDVTEYCYYCQRLRGHVPGDGLTYRDRCYDADDFGGKHEIHVPETDFISMSKWLSAIGARNRSLIRHIQLHFFTSRYVKVLGARHWGARPGKPSAVGGDFLERGLQLLASGHNLETFTISFEAPKPGEYSINLKEAPIELFSLRGAYSDRLKKALCSITRVGRFSCDPTVGKYTCREVDGSDSDCLEGVHESIREVRSSMEAGYETPTEQEVMTTWSSPYIDQVGFRAEEVEFARKLSLRELSYAEVARLGC